MKFLGIDAEVIPHSAQRYPTVGDWQWQDIYDDLQDIYDNLFKKNQKVVGQKLQINISDTGNADSNFLIMVHEIIEAYLCRKNGVKESDVDKWDMDHLDSDDPGSIEGCPYLSEHTVATSIEIMLAYSQNIGWLAHNKRIEDLDKEEVNVENINKDNIPF